MKKHLPLILLIVLPIVISSSIFVYQNLYWSGAKQATATLVGIQVTHAKEFNPGDTRRADTTEIQVNFTDDTGVKRQIVQLSPLTKYFLKQGDTLQIRYFNEAKFEGTIWNFSVKFYYIVILAGYIVLSLITLLPSFLKKRRYIKKH